MKVSRERQQESPLFESTLDEWVTSARARMTVEGLREAAEKLRLGQRAVNDVDWRGPEKR